MANELRICSCGRLHFIDEDIIGTALEQDMNVLLICGSCGRATIIGADKEPDIWGEDPDEICYNMYSCDIHEDMKEFEASSFDSTERTKGFYKIVYSKGKGVPMMSGMYAQACDANGFHENWFPDFWKIERNDVTVAEIMQFIADWRKDRSTVAMNRLLHELTDEEAELLSHYYIRGLDWSGTKYAKEWHK